MILHWKPAENRILLLFYISLIVLVDYELTFSFAGLNSYKKIFNSCSKRSVRSQRKSRPNLDELQENIPDYPYEQLLKLVEETKKIMNSSNEIEKKKLNINPFLYELYLEGNITDPKLDFGPTDFGMTPNSCTKSSKTFKPKKLVTSNGEEHYIINIKNQFSQSVEIVGCRKPNELCGDQTKWPENYEKKCVVSREVIKLLLSVPVNNISLSSQNFHAFLIPTNCECMLEKVYLE